MLACTFYGNQNNNLEVLIPGGGEVVRNMKFPYLINLKNENWIEFWTILAKNGLSKDVKKLSLILNSIWKTELPHWKYLWFCAVIRFLHLIIRSLQFLRTKRFRKFFFLRKFCYCTVNLCGLFFWLSCLKTWKIISRTEVFEYLELCLKRSFFFFRNWEYYGKENYFILEKNRCLLVYCSLSIHL